MNIKDVLVNLKISADVVRPKTVTPKEIAERVSLVAEPIQLELKMSNPDMKQVDKWLWNIRRASIPLVYHLSE
ncbi:hypothetical protein [Paenibacillus sp. Root444D2]|uniref:hypothetical protein n=1 Tax=Paenibacillus sp. Root444D2 TaxID=1736538 RepID=UPI000708B32A|nr:hypothetical protein [Paenibacillus sp. Root444D2]KQX69240.1 hypothetical protein ASD40_01700 [Paenibacillus sp. Root444D2]